LQTDANGEGDGLMETEKKVTVISRCTSFGSRLLKDVKKNKWVYSMITPVFLYYVVFCYIPLFGLIIAFQDYSPAKGFFKSEWVGFKHFIDFFSSRNSLGVIWNTISINILQIIFGFPAPIILALLINEVENRMFKKVFQTISYMPYFIPLVVMCGLITMFSRSTGIFNDILALIGFERNNLLMIPELFKPIYVSTNIYQEVGWGTIVYLATLSAIDPNLYEAASIDGCGRFRKIIHITIPSLVPVITVMFIMTMGRIMSSGFEKIILLYNPMTLSKADVIASYVYRRGFQEMNFSFGTAVDLFTAIINLIILVCANALSRRLVSESLW